MFGRLGFGEILMILVVVLLLFGPKRLPELARSMGEAMKEFKKGAQELENTIKEPVVTEEQKPEVKAEVKTEAKSEDNI